MDGYKKTIAGYIPNEWKVEKLNELVEKITDGTHKTPKYTDSGIPFLRVVDIHKQSVDWGNVKYISEEEHQELIKRCKPEKGDILYSKNGTIGIPKIIDWDREFSIFVSLCLIKMIKTGSILYNKFLAHYLKSDNCMKQIKLRAKQGTVTNLHLEEIRELNIPIPMLKEQQKIADILSTVDEQIEQTDALIEKTKELKKGLMQRLLTKGIGHTEFKKTEVGETPVEWEVKSLKEIGEIVTGNTPKTSEPENYGNEYLWVSPADMGENKYIFRTNKMLSDIGFNKIRKVSKGSVLVTCIGSTIGKIGIASEELSTNQQINSLICDVKYNNEYIYYVIDYNFKRYMSFISTQAVPIINKTVYSEFMIPIPPKEEQDKIANILSEIDIKNEGYIAKKKKLQTLKQGLMQKLLTGEIRVKVS